MMTVPTSNLDVARQVIALVHQQPHATILDVGPGAGKYGLLLREQLAEQPARLDAVEAHAPYLHQFPWLPDLYDHLYIGDVTAPSWQTRCCAGSRQVPAQLDYDLVLMVDVLEHLERAAAVELLARIPGAVVLSTPVEWFSNGPGLPDSETHRSHWAGADWSAPLGGHPVLAAYEAHGQWLVTLGKTLGKTQG